MIVTQTYGAPLKNTWEPLPKQEYWKHGNPVMSYMASHNPPLPYCLTWHKHVNCTYQNDRYWVLNLYNSTIGTSKIVLRISTIIIKNGKAILNPMVSCILGGDIMKIPWRISVTLHNDGTLSFFLYLAYCLAWELIIATFHLYYK